jgi:hypothetical protein
LPNPSYLSAVNRRLSITRADGRVVGMQAFADIEGTDPSNTVSFTYDSTGDLTGETLSFGAGYAEPGTVSYTWEPGAAPNQRRLQQMTYPTGRRIKFRYASTEPTSAWYLRPIGLQEVNASGGVIRNIHRRRPQGEASLGDPVYADDRARPGGGQHIGKANWLGSLWPHCGHALHHWLRHAR